MSFELPFEFRIGWRHVRTSRGGRRNRFISFISAVSMLGIALGVAARLDGVYNVAPDGWIPGERVRALSGGVPRLKLPDRIQEVITGLRWRFQRGPIPPGLRSYTRSPWLVANDRLRAEGWEPQVTNEQAYVEGTEAKWWTMVSPKRRQELALGAMVLGVVVAALAVVLGVRRTRQR
mgnify:CR=1 FL=1